MSWIFFLGNDSTTFAIFFLIGLVHALLVSNKQGVFLGDIWLYEQSGTLG